MSLTSFTMRNKSALSAMVAVAMGWGVFNYLTMPRRADPDFTIRTCQVITTWPGAEASRIEELVTYPLEQEINTLSEVDTIESTSRTGQSVIYVDLEDALSVDLIQETWEKVRSKVERVRPQLPPGCGDPIVDDEFGDTSVMLVALFERPRGDGVQRYSMRDLEIIADRVKESIELLPGVGRVRKDGVVNEVIELETTRRNWAGLELTIDELERILSTRNIAESGGSLDTERSRFGVTPTGEFDALEQIRRVVVDRTPEGAPIYLDDLGITVRRDYEDPPSVLARYGNTEGSYPSVVVSFTMKDRTKVNVLGAAAGKLLRDLQEVDKVIPPDIGVEIVFDESVFVDDKISSFIGNVGQAVVIVVLVAFFMAGFQSALVMAAAIPFVMIISIGVSAAIGVELEQMSIASLIIALGLLVDNAVVVSDNIRRFQAEGHNRVDAVIKGVEQIQYPILMGTLTTVFAFMPMAVFLQGQTQEYVFSIPAVVSITLLVSWVLALTITSLMAYWIIRPSADGSVTRTPLVWLLDTVLRRGKPAKPGPGLYDRLAIAAMRAKPVVLLVAVGLLVGATMLPIGTQFFPDDKRDFLYVDVWMPEGTSLAATDAAVRQLEDIMREVSPIDTEAFSGERLRHMYAAIGGSGPRFSLGVDPQPPSSSFAQIIVQTTDPDVTDQYIADIRAAAAARIPGARIIPRKLALGPPIDSPLGIRVYGFGYKDPGFGDELALRRAASQIANEFEQLDGIWDVHNSWREYGYEVKVEIDEDRASLAGVSNASVAKTLNAYLSGHLLTVFREGDHTVPVYLRLAAGERSMFEDDRTYFVEGDSGKVPLDSVARSVPRRTTILIERKDMNRMIEVRARVEPGVLANDKLAEVLPALDRVRDTWAPGLRYEIGGEMEETADNSVDLATAFGVGVLLIILLLIVNYNSFAKPLIVLLTVPLGAIGALLGLFISGNALGFMPMLGLVALAGIVVNTGILYIEFADDLIRQRVLEGRGLASPGEKSCNGLTRTAFHETLAEAGRLRLLPIFITVGTTVGGLIPLVLFGGPMWEGMSYLMIFGLLVATVLTLIVVPVFYAALVEWFGLTLVQVELPAGDAQRGG